MVRQAIPIGLIIAPVAMVAWIGVTERSPNLEPGRQRRSFQRHQNSSIRIQVIVTAQDLHSQNMDTPDSWKQLL